MKTFVHCSMLFHFVICNQFHLKDTKKENVTNNCQVVFPLCQTINQPYLHLPTAYLAKYGPDICCFRSSNPKQWSTQHQNQYQQQTTGSIQKLNNNIQLLSIPVKVWANTIIQRAHLIFLLAHSELTRSAHTVSLLWALSEFTTHNVTLLWAIREINWRAHHAVVAVSQLWSHC